MSRALPNIPPGPSAVDAASSAARAAVEPCGG